VDLFAQTANVKVKFLHQLQVAPKKCVNNSKVINLFYKVPLLAQIPLDPKLLLLIDKGKSVL
jgi:hypothetical protein